jgi:ClpP class serine protease
MTDPLADLRRADAHARWIAADSLALRPEAAAQIVSGPVLFAGYMDDDDKPSYEVDRGVAVVTIEGALMDRAGWWWDGYDAIQARVLAAHADARVRAVMLDISSPGGMVAGLFDAMRALRAARAASGKRMVAWVGSGAFSAAYGLASTCDEIVASDTAGAGSVGVIAALVSRVDQLAQDGIDVRVVSSGTEKTDGHPALPISDAAEGRLRARVGELAGMFFAEVGTGRPALTAAALSALDGGVRYGRAAIAEGLVDRIATRAALLSELQASASARQTVAPMRGITSASGATRIKTMNEETLAALAAATGETDPNAAVRTLIDRHASASASVVKLSADLSSAVERATASEKRVGEIERGAEIEAAKAAGQWSPALDGFLGSLSVEQLRAWRTSAPRVVPAGEVQPPAATHAAPQAAAGKVADAIAKAEASGWHSLSAAEKGAIIRHDKSLADALRARR